MDCWLVRYLNAAFLKSIGVALYSVIIEATHVRYVWHSQRTDSRLPRARVYMCADSEPPWSLAVPFRILYGEYFPSGW
jgi:hypothetical protein